MVEFELIPCYPCWQVDHTLLNIPKLSCYWVKYFSKVHTTPLVPRAGEGMKGHNSINFTLSGLIPLQHIDWVSRKGLENISRLRKGNQISFSLPMLISIHSLTSVCTMLFLFTSLFLIWSSSLISRSEFSSFKYLIYIKIWRHVFQCWASISTS